jgi:hypothetical protein
MTHISTPKFMDKVAAEVMQADKVVKLFRPWQLSV